MLAFSSFLTLRIKRLLWISSRQVFLLCNWQGFDDQERNLMFVKTAFLVLKPKFLACNMKQAFYPLHKQNIARAWQQEVEVFLSVYLVVKPACVNAVWHRAVRQRICIKQMEAWLEDRKVISLFPDARCKKIKSNFYYTRLIPFRVSRVSGAHRHEAFAPGPMQQGCSSGELFCFVLFHLYLPVTRKRR